jgi:hypothetical protein
MTDTPEPRSPRLLRLALAFAAGALLTLIVGYGVATVLRQSDPARTTAPQDAPSFLNAVAPTFDVRLIVGGREHSANQQLALPTGSRFELLMEAALPGTVRVLAISPRGEASELWRATLSAGQPVRAPSMSLQGPGGREMLRILFTPAEPAGVVVLREVTLVHR